MKGNGEIVGTNGGECDATFYGAGLTGVHALEVVHLVSLGLSFRRVGCGFSPRCETSFVGGLVAWGLW